MARFRGKTHNNNNSDGIDRGGRGTKQNKRHNNEQGRNNRRIGGNHRAGWRGRGGNFRDYNRFNNDRGQQYGPEMENNFDPNVHDGREILNNEAGNNQEQNFQNRINDVRSFPKFKDDNSNKFMPMHSNNRTIFDNSTIPPLLGYFESQPTNSNNNTTVNRFEYNTNSQKNQKETSNQQSIQKEPNQQDIQKSNTLIEQDKGKVVETSSNLLINIKNESTSSLKKPVQKPDSSSSSDSSSDSDSIDKLKKAIKGSSKASKKNTEKKVILPKPKIKKEPGLKESEKDSSSSDSSSSSDGEDSSSSNDEKLKKKTKKKIFEEEVICLGKLEKFENLVDDEETNCSQSNTNTIEFCILCDKNDHTSFHCQMICKNCGAQYHNLKSCPKPANLTMMLQNFLEFCLNQCTIYNPDQRFSFRNGNVQTELLPAVVPSTRNLNDSSSNFTMPPNEYLSGASKSKKMRLKSQSENLNSSKLSSGFKNKNSSESEQDNSTDSSSSLGTTSTKRKRKRQKQVQSTTPQNNITSYPGGMGFSSPFGFNPMMAAAFSQMMGFNPAAAMNYTNKDK